MSAIFSWISNKSCCQLESVDVDESAHFKVNCWAISN